MTLAFKAHVQTLLQEHRGERVFCFEHLGKTFWLKQPEQLRGVWLLLKPHPKQAFLEEREILQQLNALDAPVPKLCDFGDDYMVLEDAGVTLNNWLNNDKLTWPQKEVILQTAIRALIALHQQGIIHGRPAVRDIAWQDGEIRFMDFESHSKSQNIHWLISRDILAFLDSLCREKALNDEQLDNLFAYYRTHCPTEYWADMQAYVGKFRWLYYLLLPFKPIARTDLLAIYRLFEHLKKENL
jgi:uncharacterized protein HI_1326